MSEQLYFKGMEPEKTDYFLLFQLSPAAETFYCVGEVETLEEAERWVSDEPTSRNFEKKEREKKDGCFVQTPRKRGKKNRA